MATARTELDIAELRRMLAEGWSYREIAEALGVHNTTVRRVVREQLPDLARPAGGVMPVTFEPLRLLVVDIETSPNLAYVWGVWDQNIAPSQIVKQKEMISFAAKWVGSDEIVFKSTHHDGKRAMVLEAWNLLHDADGVIGYNSKRFDGKHIQTEFLDLDITPPSPFQHVDLLTTARREFAFGSNKLEAVADRLGLGKKREHEGFALWEKCLRGDDEAWGRMREYNMQDVRLTEDVYRKFLPWISNHPSYAAHSHDDVCPNCGSDALRADGHKYTKTGRFEQFHCLSCGMWSRARRRETMADIVETRSW